jgi:hypothetical protein
VLIRFASRDGSATLVELARPALRRLADANRVVYSLADGDQPSLICSLADWATSLGLDVIAGGQGDRGLCVHLRVSSLGCASRIQARVPDDRKALGGAHLPSVHPRPSPSGSFVQFSASVTDMATGASAHQPRFDVLFEPVQIGPVCARNRFFQVPHCNGMGYRDVSAHAEMRAVKAEGARRSSAPSRRKSTTRPRSRRSSRCGCRTTRTSRRSPASPAASTRTMRWPGSSWPATGAADGDGGRGLLVPRDDRRGRLGGHRYAQELGEPPHYGDTVPCLREVTELADARIRRGADGIG